MAYLAGQKRICVVKNYGLVPYQKAWEEQKALVTERMSNSNLKDILILLEHPPVYTLGTGATTDFLKFDFSGENLFRGKSLEKDFSDRETREVYRVERGGEVTYHCPGQLVGYPILNLKYYQPDLHWYLRQLEEVIIHLLFTYGLKGYRIPGLTGVWLEGKKVAAIGIKVRRWITMHGFAVNVCPNLEGFQDIVPCGISDKSVGSFIEFLPDLTIEKVRIDILESFAQIFNVKLTSDSEFD